MDSRIPVNIITGFLGVGKTTAILELLRRRPPGEPWAVLVNEFGKVPIDQAALREMGDDGMQVAEVAGGCLCCTAGVDMQNAMSRIVKERSPSRIIIEPTGLGHPDRLKAMLFTGSFSATLRPAAVLCLIDPRQFISDRFNHILPYWEQVKCADAVVINKSDLARDDELKACREKLARNVPEQCVIHVTEQGRLETSWLDLDTGVAPDGLLVGEHHHHALEKDHEEVALLGGRGRRLQSEGLGRHACGWIFDPDITFAFDPLTELLQAFSDSGPDHRIKGVFRTDRGWKHVNVVGPETDWVEISPGEDSRMEVISADGPKDWEQLEGELLKLVSA